MWNPGGAALGRALTTLRADLLNATTAPVDGNTQKALFETHSMTSGLYFVVIINFLVAWIGFLFYRYVILRQAPLLSPTDLLLLRKYPPVRHSQTYTPEETFTRTAPPMRWTGWRDFFTATDAHLSRDAQVYLLFQRTCLATTAVCGLISSCILLPSYWFGGALTPSHQKPISLTNLLRSDRGVFERLTSHNLPPNSPLIVLQIPVVAAAACCIIILHTLVRAATRDHRSLDDWLRQPPAPDTPAVSAVLLPAAPTDPPPSRQQHDNIAAFLGSSPRSPLPPPALNSAGGGNRPQGWTLFARGLPHDVRSRAELLNLLDAIYPEQIRSVELVCRGRMSEARLLRALSTARNRLDYLYDTPELDLLSDAGDDDVSFGVNADANVDGAAAISSGDRFGEKSDDDDGSDGGGGSDTSPEQSTLFGRFLRRVTGKRRDREGLIYDLRAEIAVLEKDLASRKAEPVRDFLGCAFITARSPEVASSLVHDFPVPLSKRPRVRAVFARREEGGSLAGAVSFQPPPRPNSTAAMSPMRLFDDAPQQQDAVLGRRASGEEEEEEDGEGPQFLGIRNLHKAMLMLIPVGVRRRFWPSSARTAPHGENGGRDLPSPRARNVRYTREVAIERLRRMKAERAPKSGDVVWSNIGISLFERMCREVLVQMFVFACLILFTSPVAMLTAMRLVFAELSLLSDVGNMGHNVTMPAPITVPAPIVSMLAPFNGSLDSTLESALSTANAVGAVANAVVERLSLADIGADDNAADDISQQVMNMLPTFLTSNSLMRSVLLAYIPVLLLSFVFAIVPSLLRLISNLEGYPTHSDREMSIFRKTSFYYLMNAVLLPSLALNTASEFLEMVYKQSDGGANVYNALPILQSLFSGDIAYFLCNYLVQLALTGSVFWLMRLPSSLSMMVRRRLALTPLEAAEAKCTSIFDFPRHFSYSVAVMSMCLLFGFMAPLVWGFAFLYYVCKHAVDTYLIRYVHPRSHIDGRLPRLATTFVLVWTCVTQLALAVIFYLQGRVRAALATGLLCAVTLAACVSVGPQIGNRLLLVIPRIRDYLIRRYITSDSDGWFGQRSFILASSTSTSSSSTSLAGSQNEEDPLLPGRKGFPGVDPRFSARRLSAGMELSDDDSAEAEVDEVGPLQHTFLEEGRGSYGST